MTVPQILGEFLARVLLAAIFLLSGIQKITQYAGAEVYMESSGLPGILLPVVIALEIGGALALILGLMTRWVALALSAFCIATALLFHDQLDDAMQFIMFWKNMAMAGGFLAIAAHGPGPLSLDAKYRGVGRSAAADLPSPARQAPGL